METKEYKCLSCSKKYPENKLMVICENGHLLCNECISNLDECPKCHNPFKAYLIHGFKPEKEKEKDDKKEDENEKEKDDKKDDKTKTKEYKCLSCSKKYPENKLMVICENEHLVCKECISNLDECPKCHNPLKAYAIHGFKPEKEKEKDDKKEDENEKEKDDKKDDKTKTKEYKCLSCSKKYPENKLMVICENEHLLCKGCILKLDKCPKCHNPLKAYAIHGFKPEKPRPIPIEKTQKLDWFEKITIVITLIVLVGFAIYFYRRKKFDK
ncbi:e3 ubiquitin-protein ligase siah2 [Anaeramoeba ignava]|uniref:E3 ubiquitin-protein ligase siah2 n=1 Tax=Anaeramoeba ignava TaxID=1746090 RepID=A0A9Q0RGT6_ANAIG|nr:e3 ubiquitin-protein ligase siah2 [Anaeramoeba ignava]